MFAIFDEDSIDLHLKNKKSIKYEANASGEVLMNIKPFLGGLNKVIIEELETYLNN